MKKYIIILAIATIALRIQAISRYVSESNYDAVFEASICIAWIVSAILILNPSFRIKVYYLTKDKDIYKPFKCDLLCLLNGEKFKDKMTIIKLCRLSKYSCQKLCDKLNRNNI